MWTWEQSLINLDDKLIKLTLIEVRNTLGDDDNVQMNNSYGLVIPRMILIQGNRQKKVKITLTRISSLIVQDTHSYQLNEP